MNESSKTLEQLTIGKKILIEFREEGGYSHLLLSAIEERIDFIKGEQSN